MSEKLKTLKGLSEDVSESDLLRCRIEQQAELIYILKQRADEYLKKYMEVEDRTASVQVDATDMAKKYEAEKRAHALLQDRFDTLEKNHRELTIIKDEYKSENKELLKDNERLQSVSNSLYSEMVEEKNKVIAKLTKDLLTVQSKLEDATKKEKNLENRLQVVRRQMEKEICDLSSALENQQTASKESVGQLEHKLSMAEVEQTSLQHALNESTEAIKLHEETKLFLERRCSEFQNQIDALLKQLEEEREKYKALEQKSRRDSESNSISYTIRRLNAEIQEERKLKTKLLKEYDAFKQHTSTLLSKERELNMKLRRLNFP